MFQGKVLAAAPVMALLLCGTANAAIDRGSVVGGLAGACVGQWRTLTAATEVKEDGGLTLNGVSLAGPSGSAPVTVSELYLKRKRTAAFPCSPVKSASRRRFGKDHAEA